MQKWARIVNGKVREIIDFDPIGRYHPSIEAEFIKCLDEVRQGWLYNGTFHPYVKSQDEIKQETIIDLKLQLENMDKKLPRNLEDYIDFQISIGIHTEEELPSFLKNNKNIKKQLRQQLQELGG